MVRLFLDTDFGPDCDDAGALQVAHWLCDAGEAELLGVTHCTGNSFALPAISAVNRFNGREVPLGTSPRTGFLAEYQKYNRPIAQDFPHEFTDGQPQRSACEVFREVMEAQEDGSVVLCSIGPLNNLADFLDEPACRALIARKVCRLVAMAGRFDSTGNAEWNIQMDIPAARKVLAEWPGEVIFCSFECGSGVITGQSLAGLPAHPIEYAYRLWNDGAGTTRKSWDLLTVLYAVRGDNALVGISPWGNIRMNEEGVTTHTPDPTGRQAYTVNIASDEVIAAALEEMISARKTPAGKR